jgi:hypothetical protein
MVYGLWFVCHTLFSAACQVLVLAERIGAQEQKLQTRNYKPETTNQKLQTRNYKPETTNRKPNPEP